MILVISLRLSLILTTSTPVLVVGWLWKVIYENFDGF